MQDRPDASELAAAVAQYLAHDLLALVPREQRFNVRVAANSCAILAREFALDLAPDPERREAERQLAASIRDGDHDDRWDEALALLRDSVRAKLAVAHPGYDDFADDGRG